ncbi:uncharacterized protein A1O5_03160 [Cladophialophora psammophila CBS 110553]|uniref:Heterokaryon incompatibility domain-containing protein n=1 Tax=Cladophialophora psammophila CBS 110553 TaxID=1182543 RepID=W9X7W6_9EURO|nr:uncharacterized protein A1O5_03160 [Cladophialophora psammophila CBS 110553]EXJ73400.1 hypothetical protein A1O5_03160 [Cladophialophora psammophila CBS 110553]
MPAVRAPANQPVSSKLVLPDVVVKADAGLCKDRQLLFTNIVSGPDLLDGRWETIQSEHVTLTHWKAHPDNYLGSFRQSASGFCGLWIVPQKCEFKVAIGAATEFVAHISEWKHRLNSIVFFRRNGNKNSLPFSSNQQAARYAALHVLPDPDPGSGAAFQRAKQWVDDSMHRHDKCVGDPTPLPKRVEDIGNAKKIAPYVTISYKWGEDHPLKTRDGNLEERRKGIALEAFLQTLRDGVVIAKILGFRYIWIDSLCIIQGNKLDWFQQSEEMTAIYGMSTLNISASSSESNRAGILKTRPEQNLKVGVWSHSNSHSNCETIFAGDVKGTTPWSGLLSHPACAEVILIQGTAELE